jgi:hypothetical protein
VKVLEQAPSRLIVIVVERKRRRVRGTSALKTSIRPIFAWMVGTKASRRISHNPIDPNPLK